MFRSVANATSLFAGYYSESCDNRGNPSADEIFVEHRKFVIFATVHVTTMTSCYRCYVLHHYIVYIHAND